MREKENILPLSALLSKLLVAYTVELDNKFELQMSREGFPGARLSLVMWLNVIRFIPPEGVTFRDLTTHYLGSRESLKLQLGCLERWRFIEFDQDSPFPKDRDPKKNSYITSGRRRGWGTGQGITLDWIIKLKASGKKAVSIWPNLISEVDDLWERRFKEGEADQLRQSLRNIADKFSLDLPWGLWPDLEIMESESFHHRSGATDENLPLPALLSQVLLKYALDFDRKSRVSLGLCANVIRVLGKNPVKAAELPALTGGSSEASDIGWRLKPFVFVQNDPSGARGKSIRLSELGSRTQENYYRITGEVEKDWETKYGSVAVKDLRRSLERMLGERNVGISTLSQGLVPPEGVARAGAPIPALGRKDMGPAGRRRVRDLVNQTKRFVEDPENSLPHYPSWDMNRGFGP